MPSSLRPHAGVLCQDYRTEAAASEPLLRGASWLRRAPARTVGEGLGAHPAREAPSAYLGAARLILAVGSSEVELCEPSGPGPAADHLRSQGEGVITAGFSTRDMAALRAHPEGPG